MKEYEYTHKAQVIWSSIIFNTLQIIVQLIYFVLKGTLLR